MSTIYHFKVEDAISYGVNAAIILTNIQYWILKNKDNDRNYHDGHYWTYNSTSTFAQLFPFFTKKQIRTALNKLVKAGVLITGNYNKTPYDRTTWYALKDESMLSICPSGKMEMPLSADGNDQKGEPIPDIKPDSIPNLKPINKDIMKNNKMDTSPNDFDYKQVDSFWIPRAKEYFKTVPIKREEWANIIRRLKMEYQISESDILKIQSFLSNRPVTQGFCWFDQIRTPLKLLKRSKNLESMYYEIILAESKKNESTRPKATNRPDRTGKVDL